MKRPKFVVHPVTGSTSERAHLQLTGGSTVSAKLVAEIAGDVSSDAPVRMIEREGHPNFDTLAAQLAQVLVAQSAQATQIRELSGRIEALVAEVGRLRADDGAAQPP